MKTLKLLPFAALAILSSCKSGDDDISNPENEEELITTVTITLTDSADANNVITATFKDTDGEGGNEPTQFDTLRLSQGVVYNGSISLLNESDADDVEDITEEVEEEADEHLFCYDVDAHVDIERTDTDGSHEVGLETKWSTYNMTGQGTVTVSLKHQPDGEKDGTCEVGYTDIELSFVVIVE